MNFPTEIYRRHSGYRTGKSRYRIDFKKWYSWQPYYLL